MPLQWDVGTIMRKRAEMSPDKEGFFYIVDRAKDMYRTGGENVCRAEAEKILAGHPKIANVAIFGVPDEKWGETGLVFVVPAKGQSITLDEVNGYLEGKTVRFKHPRQIRFMDDLPLTTTMKIKKSELKEKVLLQTTDTSRRKEAKREAI